MPIRMSARPCLALGSLLRGRRPALPPAPGQGRTPRPGHRHSRHVLECGEQLTTTTIQRSEHLASPGRPFPIRRETRQDAEMPTRYVTSVGKRSRNRSTTVGAATTEAHFKPGIFHVFDADMIATACRSATRRQLSRMVCAVPHASVIGACTSSAITTTSCSAARSAIRRRSSTA